MFQLIFKHINFLLPKIQIFTKPLHKKSTKTNGLLVMMMIAVLMTACQNQKILTSANLPAIAEAQQEKLDLYLNNLQDINESYDGVIWAFNDHKTVAYASRGTIHHAVDVKPDENTMFDLASVSKFLNALMILKLWDEGTVDIYQPIEKYVKSLKDTDLGEKNIFELLTHQAGLQYYNIPKLYEYYDVERTDFSLDSLLSGIAEIELPETPDKPVYSNISPIIAAYVMEQITSESIEEMMKKHVFVPLDLNQTGLNLTDTEIQKMTKNRANPQEKDYAYYYQSQIRRPGVLLGAAGMYSSASDLKKVMQAVFYQKTFLSEKSYNVLTNNDIKDDDGASWNPGLYALQIDLNSGSKVKTYAHQGLIFGASAYIAYFPESETSLVMLSNRGFTANMDKVISEVINIIHENEFNTPKHRLDYYLRDLEDKSIFEDEIKKLSTQDTYKDKFRLDENELNNYGYGLVEEKKYNYAEAIFRLICSLYPDASNPYDSLGEILFIRGKYEESLENYEKSLSLDPKNANAQEYITKIKSVLKKE